MDFSGLVWRKSSRSGNASNDACVEVAFGSGAVGVRDSKHPEAGPLVFGRRAWETFLAKPV